MTTTHHLHTIQGFHIYCEDEVNEMHPKITMVLLKSDNSYRVSMCVENGDPDGYYCIECHRYAISKVDGKRSRSKICETYGPLSEQLKAGWNKLPQETKEEYNRVAREGHPEDRVHVRKATPAKIRTKARHAGRSAKPSKVSASVSTTHKAPTEETEGERNNKNKDSKGGEVALSRREEKEEEEGEERDNNESEDSNPSSEKPRNPRKFTLVQERALTAAKAIADKRTTTTTTPQSPAKPTANGEGDDKSTMNTLDLLSLFFKPHEKTDRGHQSLGSSTSSSCTLKAGSKRSHDQTTNKMQIGVLEVVNLNRNKRTRLCYEETDFYHVCDICGEQVANEYGLAHHLPCNHVFCKNCLSSSLKEHISSGKIPLKCPGVAEGEDGRSKEPCCVVLSQSRLKAVLSPSEYENYHNMLSTRFMETGKEEYSICPYPKCHAPYWFTKELNTCACACPECKMLICGTCGNIYHHNNECNNERSDIGQLRNDAMDADLKEYIKNTSNNIVTCPNCHFTLEKDGGCTCIMCKKCTTPFCSECYHVQDNHHIAKKHYPLCKLRGK